MKKLNFNEAEIAQPEDITAIGDHARDGMDHLVGGAIAYPRHWSAFTTEEIGPTTLRVTPGRLFSNDIVYSADLATDLDLMLQLPGVSSNRRWVGIIAQGSEVTTSETREVEVDVETQETTFISVPKVIDRKVSFVYLTGAPEISEDPVKPTVPGDACCVAFVLLGSTGIIRTEPGTEWRVRTLYEVEGRVTTLEFTLEDTIQRTSTLETDLANLAGRLNKIPRPELMRQLQRDAAIVRKRLNVPDDARAYWYDPGLLEEDWDKLHASWLARINEGIRFGYAQIVDIQLSILNPSDPALKFTGDMMMPDWEEVTRVTVDGTGSSKDISQQTHTVTTLVRRDVSGTSIKYGPTINICENAAEWDIVKEKHVGETFSVNGVQYISDGLSTGTHTTGADLGQWNADPGHVGHQAYALRSVQYESWTETYWDEHIQEYGVNGSIYGNTFLNSQPCIVTSIDLKLLRVGADGDVHLFLCECDATGGPNFTKVIAESTVTAANLTVGWQKFPIRPALLDAGKRYAWFTVTVGNHAVATVLANKYAQGSLFWCTDGVWAFGSPTEDFCFKINTAKFTATRTVVLFNSLACPDGMTELQLLYTSWAPAGTAIMWEIKPTGATEWTVINEGDPDPLVGLPPLAQLRATFVGTTDLAPMIKMDSTARGATFRHRNTMQAISDLQAFGFSTSTIVLETTVDNFDDAVHDLTNRLYIGAGFVTATVTTTEADLDKPGRFIVTSSFTLGAPATGARAAPSMATSNVVQIPFIQNIAMYGI